jgi:hypothetical protein
MTKIIGFGGKKGCGKDTAGDFLVKNSKEFWGPNITVKKYHYANKLKEFCRDFLKVPSKWLWGTDADKDNLVHHILWEDMPHYASLSRNVLVLSTKEEIFDLEDNSYYERPSGPMSVRQILQQVGTEWFRKLRHNIWVEMCFEQINKDGLDFALICDVRFPNEVDVIKESGGLAVYLTRSIGESSHSSETSLDCKNYDWSNFNCVIHNDKMSVFETQQYIVAWLRHIRLISK